MAFGLWKKIKTGAKKVIGGIGKGIKIAQKVLPTVAKVLPTAGGIAGGLIGKFNPKLGEKISSGASKISSMIGGGEDDIEDTNSFDNTSNDSNEIQPRFKVRPMVMSNKGRMLNRTRDLSLIRD
jgi:hypothetical protein